MVKSTELEMLYKICKTSARKRKINDADKKRLVKAFGERFIKAMKAVEDERVKKYVFKPSNHVVWIVVGRNKDYFIMPAVDFCTCDDFYFRVLDKQIHLCYHLIAQKLAENLEKYVLYEEDDKLYSVLMKEWREAIV